MQNTEDFCKYHDGYFKKEKLVHRMWLHLDEAAQEKTEYLLIKVMIAVGFWSIGRKV